MADKATDLYPEKPEAPQKLKILVLVPSRGAGVNIRFTYDLAQLMAYTATTIVNIEVADLGLMVGERTYIDNNRDDLSAASLLARASHALWLDDDMRFPKDALIQLLKRDVDFVGANYATRIVSSGIAPTAIRYIGDDPENPAERVYTRPDSTGIEKVEAIGFGVTLMRTHVLGEVGHPFFEQYFDHKKTRWMGEDVGFCVKATAAGIKIFVDHDLSKEVSHIGTFEFRLEHTLMWEEEHSGGKLIKP